METLTKAEEKAMKILWLINNGLIRDVVKEYDEPKPAYTTVATIIKILEKKGFVGRRAIANTFEYYPLIKEEDYSKKYMKSFVKRYFSDSFKSMVSAFGTNEELSTQEMEDLIKHFQSQIDKKKTE
ncbi:BlaI/MecI/CopY family transcriptional regulator [Ekhidna sp. To15]|uniref:BlaI/MecI/CopY family transcriptional regulator n=1 Tax=Ekhidna sp. To15 TaxID=3395267 RepID=UPI003F5210AC